MPESCNSVFRALHLTCKAMSIVALLMLVLMTALIILQVVFRNLIDIGLPWASELARFSCIALVFLASPALLLRDQHIAVDIVANMLNKRGKLLLYKLNAALLILFFSILLYGFYAFLSRAAKFSTPAMGMPNWAFYSPPLIGLFLLGIISIYQLLSRPQISKPCKGGTIS